MYYFCNIHRNLTPQLVKITILQTDIKWKDIDRNILNAESLIDTAPGADLYVLPEMWATGFVTSSPEDVCSYVPLDWMKNLARIRQCAVCGSLPVMVSDGKLRNRQYFVLPDGEFYYYDKRHLFAYGGEDEHYVKGRRRVVAEFKGIRFLLQTCYDLRFPVWMRNQEDYDAIIFVANWPESRKEVWNVLLRARAIENQCYVIGANRTGCDPSCSYIGGSAIIGPKGDILASANGNGAQSVTYSIDMNSLIAFRKKFPVLADRDLFDIRHD